MSASFGQNARLHNRLARGLPFQILAAICAGELIVVLFHPDEDLASAGQFQNLRAYRGDGSEAWRAALPTNDSSDCFVSIGVNSHRSVHARSFSGFSCDVNLTTGRLDSKEFTK